MLLDYRYRLEFVLGGAITTNQLDFTAEYEDQNIASEISRPTFALGVSNNTTDVVLVSAPGTAGFMRRITRLSIYNRDTVNASVTVKYDVAAGGGTEYIVIRVNVLATLTALHYDRNRGWYVL